MKRTIAFLSLSLVLAVTAFAHPSHQPTKSGSGACAACCSDACAKSCCSDGCAKTCCPEGCGDDCCQGK